MKRGAQPSPPTDAELAARLGRSHAAYRRLLERSPELRPEWKYYGPKSGWTLKLFEGRRNLCFISPQQGCFTIAFLLGEKAVAQALAAAIPADIEAQIRTARTYVEGRPVKLVVRTIADLATPELLLRIKRDN